MVLRKNISFLTCICVAFFVFAILFSAACVSNAGSSVNASGSDSSPEPASPDPAGGPGIYIAGRYDGSSIYDTRSCYWKDGVRTNFEGTFSDALGITVVDNDVYVAGYYDEGTSRACYWKNGVRTTLADVNSRAFAITVVNSGETQDVYVVGYFNSDNGDSLACYWKNGVLTPVTNDESTGYAIAVVNTGGTTDVYIAGQYKGNDKVYYACYWKNGQRTIISNIESEVWAITVLNNDVYVAGHYRPGIVWFACYWKNGQRVNLGSVSSRVLGMTAVNTGGTVDIYYTGWYVDSNGFDKGCYWKNNAQQRTTLPSGNFSRTNAITIVDNDVYVAGVCDDEPVNKWRACYWKNEERTFLPAGDGNSSVNAIVVVK